MRSTKAFSQLRVAALFSLCGLSFIAGPKAASGAIAFGQLDDFQNGTTSGWQEGSPSPNPPTNVATGGPGGAGDRFLQNVSSGSGGAGGKQIMFNQAQWTGDFNTAGVTRIEAKMANFSATPLHMRLAIERRGTGDEWGSTASVDLPADGVWRPVAFELTSAGLSRLVGTQTLESVLGDVNAFRVLSASAGPAFNGDQVAATLGVDDIRALRLPGDANFDGRVDLADFDILKANFLQSEKTWRKADFDFNGLTDIADFGILRNGFGQALPGVAAAPVTPEDQAILDAFGGATVPEPCAGALFLTAAGMGLFRRGRRQVR